MIYESGDGDDTKRSFLPHVTFFFTILLYSYSVDIFFNFLTLIPKTFFKARNAILEPVAVLHNAGFFSFQPFNKTVPSKPLLKHYSRVKE